MTKLEYLTPEARAELLAEHTQEMEKRHKEQVEFLERQAAKERAELQHRLSLIDQSTVLRAAKDGSEELLKLQQSFEHSKLTEEQKSLVKDAARFYGHESTKNSGDLNRLALTSQLRYRAVRDTAKALGLVRG